MATTVLLPPGKKIYLTVFTDAAYLQKITVTPPAGAGNPYTVQGSGENNHVIGSENFTTPSGTQNLSYEVNIVYSSNNGGSWNQSSLISGETVVGSMNMQIVLSEDHVDNDYNDCVAQFVWWEPIT